MAYAADRGIRVIPEIDVPGHVNHWLLAYPEWGSEQAKPSQRFGVHPGCLDPTQESVYQALETLFAEVAEVFPDRFVHVGGDEVNPKWWQRAEHIQAFIAEHDLKDARGLQNYFLCRLQISLAALNKQIIGWDEVLHEQMPDCLVQNWRGATTRDRALAVPRPCIVSAPYYLDLHFPADIHYRFDPTATQQDWLRMEDDLATDLRLEHIAEAPVGRINGGVEPLLLTTQNQVPRSLVARRVNGLNWWMARPCRCACGAACPPSPSGCGPMRTVEM